MATGFMQRFRGKIATRAIWTKEFVGLTPGITASTTVTLDYSAIQVLPASSLAQIFLMPPPRLGQEVTLATATGVSAGTGTRVVWATTGSFFGTTNTTITFSTVTPSAVTLYGVSTLLWITENSTSAGPVAA